MYLKVFFMSLKQLLQKQFSNTFQPIKSLSSGIQSFFQQRKERRDFVKGLETNPQGSWQN